ncbi:hypothetical protein [Streptomyces sp. UNOC14_S4]|uniref:hypothetical protein n=1 Tax=Streptomyces sp. UNOC14_S4 TaxID=2872340 RepID=UPI001E63EB48|nr:hypothetical protein [Streptomyces sp. UNOC14_S4]MCC3766472.1 hypothetical protein [Streptomyces sp. UNOC14_S4]
MFQQRTNEAVDRHLAQLVDVSKVYDLAAGWDEVDPAPGSNALRSRYFLQSARTAKYCLLGELRRTRSSCGIDLTPVGFGVSVHEAYELVINATGPIAFTMGRFRYYLTYQGTYHNDARTTPSEQARRRPHPDLDRDY